MMFNKILLVALVLGFSGCSSQRSGYFESKRLGHNIFEITFKGSPSFSNDEALQFCLLRCAEVTVQRGYKFFTVSDEDSGLYTYFYRTLGGEWRISTINTIAYNVITCTNQIPAGKEHLFLNAQQFISNQ